MAWAVCERPGCAADRATGRLTFCECSGTGWIRVDGDDTEPTKVIPFETHAEMRNRPMRDERQGS